jgi:hypothetical protein
MMTFLMIGMATLTDSTRTTEIPRRYPVNSVLIASDEARNFVALCGPLSLAWVLSSKGKAVNFC